jgi:hypothetical protein
MIAERWVRENSGKVVPDKLCKFLTAIIGKLGYLRLDIVLATVQYSRFRYFQAIIEITQK